MVEITRAWGSFWWSSMGENNAPAIVSGEQAVKEMGE